VDGWFDDSGPCMKSPVQDSRRQATEGQSQSVRLPEPRLKIAPYQRSILVGYVDKIRRVG
jgi:hypothetical protein